MAMFCESRAKSLVKRQILNPKSQGNPKVSTSQADASFGICRIRNLPGIWGLGFGIWDFRIGSDFQFRVLG